MEKGSRPFTLSRYRDTGVLVNSEKTMSAKYKLSASTGL